MIKPEEVTFERPTHTQAHLDEAEKQFDAAIRNAENSGEWPARVLNYRDDMPRSAIAETARRYRAAGWPVVVSPAGGDRVHIAKP